jgi:hypothetical protein
MDAYHTLVIVLSVILAIGLLLSAIAIGIFVKILRDIRHITEKAASAADNIENAAHIFRNTSGIAAVTKLIGNAVEMFGRSRRTKTK